MHVCPVACRSHSSSRGDLCAMHVLLPFKGSDISIIDVVTRNLTPRFNPRRHKWATHFRWKGAYLVVRTPIGRVTVDLLHINDELRVELRESLMAEGLF
jgi:hypothetical protein